MDRPNILVTATAIVYFVASIATIFAGEELLAAFQARRTVLELALIQLLGAALFGFAMLNWFHRYSRIGGILGRPLIVANLAHAMTAALMPLQIGRGTGWPSSLMLGIVLYGSIAVAFGSKLFLPPWSSRTGA